MPHSPIRRLLAAAALGIAAASLPALSGCASLQAVDNSVSAFGSWPDGKVPGTYRFDRLLSQQADPQRQDMLEAAASHALAVSGFKPAADGAKPDVTVQIGARIDRLESSPWDDPLWIPGPGRYRGGFGFPNAWAVPYGPYGIGGPFGPFGHPWAAQPDQYQRETALLIRDSVDGKPLYEARATSSGFAAGGPRLLGAMFDASMSDFPHANDKPHDVTVPLERLPAAAAASAAASANLR